MSPQASTRGHYQTFSQLFCCYCCSMWFSKFFFHEKLFVTIYNFSLSCFVPSFLISFLSTSGYISHLSQTHLGKETPAPKWGNGSQCKCRWSQAEYKDFPIGPISTMQGDDFVPECFHCWIRGSQKSQPILGPATMPGHLKVLSRNPPTNATHKNNDHIQGSSQFVTGQTVPRTFHLNSDVSYQAIYMDPRTVYIVHRDANVGLVCDSRFLKMIRSLEWSFIALISRHLARTGKMQMGGSRGFYSFRPASRSELLV